MFTKRNIWPYHELYFLSDIHYNINQKSTPKSSDFPAKFLYICYLSHACCMPCHLLSDLITLVISDVKCMLPETSLSSCLHSPVTYLSLLNILSAPCLFQQFDESILDSLFSISGWHSRAVMSLVTGVLNLKHLKETVDHKYLFLYIYIFEISYT